MKKDDIKIMEVCGTHTMAIARFGIKKLLPKNVKLISGPGCPVCVTSDNEIDKAIKLSLEKDIIITTFGDMMRVPGSSSSLEDMKRRGSDIRIVYSPLDALKIAKTHPDKRIVFMGVGFETTSPLIAATILEAKKNKISNFFILANFKIIFPALEYLSKSKDLKIDGFLCPGHVSVITGSRAYREVAKRCKKSCVIAGFEAVDILKAIKILLREIRLNKNNVIIEYKRAVKENGNKKALKLLKEVFEIKDSDWRGLGTVPKSGLKLRRKYSNFDAEKVFKIDIPKKRLRKGCVCGEILKGKKEPSECSLFRKKCTPRNPIGPCMVSSEGACSAYYKYGE